MKFIFTTLLLFFSLFVFAQSMKFWAKADAKQVPLGGYFELSYVVQNASLEDIEIPNFKDFIKKTDPISSVSYQSGIKTEQISITLQSKKLGLFTIPAAKIKINGVFFLTNAVSVEVVKQGIKSEKVNMLVEMNVANKENYLGAPILLEIKSYSTVPIQSFSELSLPNLERFISQEISNLEDKPIKEIINGIEYETQIIKRYWLYPQTIGIVKISPLVINAFIKEKNLDLKSIGLQSNELTLNINKLPEHAPDGFKGVVGKYKLFCSFDKDNNARLRVMIKGIGDIKRIHAPSIIHSDSIDILEPNLLQEKIENDTSLKVYEFILMAKQNCQSNIKVVFPYFDTEKNQYQVLSQQLSINLKAVATNPISENTQPNEQIQHVNTNRKYLYLAFIISLLSLFFYFFKKDRLQKQEKIEKGISNNLEKKPINRTISIIEIERELQTGNTSLFYKNASLLIHSQLFTYFKLPRNSSRSTLINKLSQSDKKNLAEPINSFLDRCDAARFGAALEAFDAHKDLILLKEIMEKIS